MAVTLVGALILVDWLMLGGDVVRRRWKYYMPFAVLGLVYVALTRQFVDRAMLLKPVRSLDIHIWTQVKAVVYYLIAGRPNSAAWTLATPNASSNSSLRMRIDD